MALTPNVPPYFNQSSRRIDDHVVQLQLKIVNNYTYLIGTELIVGEWELSLCEA